MNNITFNEEAMRNLLDFIKKICGNDLSSKRDIIKGKITDFCNSHNFESVDEMIDKVGKNRIYKQELINLVTINETYFLRERQQLEAVMQYANTIDGPIRILCAPCSSGEEAYTLGIIAKGMGIDRYRLKIIGIDINSDVIKKCQEGRYSKRSLQNVTPAQVSTFFTEDGDFYKIKKELLPMINFQVENIFDDNIFKLGTFDVILSRNMLIYFDEYHRAMSIERFHKLLKPEGRFYAGKADIIPSSEIFRKVVDFSTTYYQKL